MKPEKFTTENTEKKNFRFFKSSVNSVVASSQKELQGNKEKENPNRESISEDTEGRE